ncbi:MAG TPA: hypothetical protein VKO20_09980, partial [Desulfosalsimonadaceae bacterium]|nr:hypothetical protein [Desulfosalsimonadaceae bacterium]
MSAGDVFVRPVVRSAVFCMAHVPGLVLSGSKPRREIAYDRNGLRQRIVAHLRTFTDAVAYPPHQVMIGNLPPERLSAIKRPWHLHPLREAKPEGPAGRFVDEAGFYAWLARADCARLLRLSQSVPPALE